MNENQDKRHRKVIMEEGIEHKSKKKEEKTHWSFIRESPKVIGESGYGRRRSLSLER